MDVIDDNVACVVKAFESNMNVGFDVEPISRDTSAPADLPIRIEGTAANVSRGVSVSFPVTIHFDEQSWLLDVAGKLRIVAPTAPVSGHALFCARSTVTVSSMRFFLRYSTEHLPVSSCVRRCRRPTLRAS